MRNSSPRVHPLLQILKLSSSSSTTTTTTTSSSSSSPPPSPASPLHAPACAAASPPPSVFPPPASAAAAAHGHPPSSASTHSTAYLQLRSHPLKLQPHSPYHTPGALQQHGQHGNVSVSFISPQDGSVWPLGSSGHVTHVPVQLQVLNMWFEGERAPLPPNVTIFQ